MNILQFIEIGGGGIYEFQLWNKWTTPYTKVQNKTNVNSWFDKPSNIKDKFDMLIKYWFGFIFILHIKKKEILINKLGLSK